jgi:recombination protein RecT
MSEPGTDVVRKAGGLTQFIETYADDFAAVVPKHVEISTFMGLASAMVRSDQYLRQAAQSNPGSLIIALRQCAADGHVPRKGIASLVGYRDRAAPGGFSVSYIEEVNGTIERIYRAGAVTAVHDEIVRQNDVFRPVRGALPVHEFDWSASAEDRGPLVGVYAWATLFTGGISRVVVLNRHDVARYRSMSASAKSTRTPGGNFWGPEWPNEGPNTAAMWRKTALHRLERYVPASAAYRWEVAQAEAAALAPNRFTGMPDEPLRGSVPADVHEGGEDIQDAEILDDRLAEGTQSGDWPDVRQPGKEGEQ